MPTLHFIAKGPDAEPRTTTLQAPAGKSLMQVAVDAGLQGMAADCGGLLTCATCHVYVSEPWRAQLPAPGADEEGMLDFVAAPRQPGSRLSCQITLTEALDGLTVELPPVQY